WVKRSQHGSNFPQTLGSRVGPARGRENYQCRTGSQTNRTHGVAPDHWYRFTACDGHVRFYGIGAGSHRFPPTAALFFSGVGTLIFLVITQGRVPSYLGSSFAFIAPLVAATSMQSMAVASGGIIVTGAALVIVGAIVHKAGTRWIPAVMPPVVMGTI